ncbi:uncharacterized protein HD556DRAFT_1303012 [Suillus plorans]|uniref:Uncharacterized protein n=1 Tax=Suillus plorans TaxID=116603 RepID=A0A9P7DYR2_9AGAM|nr:uncharacterized protein HD556DRAFT_1303012 [Suillus plorans]KAG1806580.1 hypothetical protein HD556DRAFT_1303012 [Suillus plorans]
MSHLLLLGRKDFPLLHNDTISFAISAQSFLLARTHVAMFPATSPLPRNYSFTAQETTHLRMNARENSRHTTEPSSAATSTTFMARLHDLWTGHALPPIVDVLAQGKERNVAAGAPPKNKDWIPDEDHVPSRPASPNPNSQQPPAAQINAGEHGSDRLCGCF